MTGLKDSKGILVKTGNVLNLNDILKKPGQQSSDELLECLKITLADSNRSSNEDLCVITGKEPVYTEDIDPKELVITVKVFLNSGSVETLKSALDNCVEYLSAPVLGSLVLAYQREKFSIQELHSLWTVLEDYTRHGKLERIGISDLDTDSFIELYNWSSIKPSLVQLGLAGCCVVPPKLQDFAKAHDIQLLTHGDPADILPQERLQQLLPEVTKQEQWFVCRFQGHIKCRGVLATKGYIVGIRLG
ncbi:glutamate--cysteine ligase regulatory subunit [Cimex lectularius]|uniref:GCS light chain n=1 Tax=Cimex lectularius TaxID=79782 RepID=A0A8I6SQ47_CIMLE|nr:glutamate--cysteine ligase regulatory subunit [Cimex lectularius]